MLAHIGGLPVEENLIYLGPVLAVVGFIYFQSWRERRHPDRFAHLDNTDPELDCDDDELDTLGQEDRRLPTERGQQNSSEAA